MGTCRKRKGINDEVAIETKFRLVNRVVPVEARGAIEDAGNQQSLKLDGKHIG
jgi:hypothetical protein